MLRWYLLLAGACLAAAQTRTIESVLTGLQYGEECSTSIELDNMSRRAVQVTVESHSESGSLVPLRERQGMQVDIAALKHASVRLEGATGAAWVKVREMVAGNASPSVAVTGMLVCVPGNRLIAHALEVALPTANPWFSGDVTSLPGSEVALVNTSSAAVTATGCYSSGTLVSRDGSEFEPVCSESFHEQIPPFGARQYPVRHGESTHFALRTHGQGIVLQMMKPVASTVRIFQVDSTIHFGSEVPVK